eukprot:gene764-1071_t
MAQRVDAQNIKPLHFWKQYISQRQPGDVTVEVEHRGDISEGYGQGKKMPMPVRQLIQAMQQGDSSLYMSTQEVGVGRDGHPLLYGPPVLQLTDVVPQQQPLMGHLVPQSINMWMGCAPQGSSTGLHHDYHDNLYVLLRGCKRFRLYPPSAAPDMYVTGSIKKIYPNGRIVYADQGDVNADGSGSDVDGDYNDDGDDLQGSAEQHCTSKQHGIAAATNRSISSPAAASNSSIPPSAGQAHKVALAAAPRPPPSFSQVDLSLPQHKLQVLFPRFPGLAAALEVVLQAGDMLYMPAGWFHEVTSYGGGGLDGGHLAINYWYHPPDNLVSSKSGFNHPYTSSYYPTVWKNRQEGVGSPTNKYHMSMTRSGTASGDVQRLPGDISII